MWNPSSVEQETLWLSELSGRVGSANNTPLAIEMASEDGGRSVEQALDAVNQAQPMLRSRFAEQSGRLRWTSRNHGSMIEHVHEPRAQWDKTIAALSRDPVQLLSPAPIRAWMLHASAGDDGSVVLLLNCHHCAFDGLSKAILVRQLMSAHRAHRASARPAIHLGRDYSEYPRRQARAVEQLDRAARAFWAPRFARMAEDHRPADDARHSISGEALAFSFGTPANRGLDALAKEVGVSRFAVLLAAVQATQRDESVSSIATMVAAGTRDESDNDTVGLYVNVLPVVTAVAAGTTRRRFVELVAAACRATLKLRRYPYATAMRRFAYGTNPGWLSPRVYLSYRSVSLRHDPDPLYKVDWLLPSYGVWWTAGLRVLDDGQRVDGVLDFDPAVLSVRAAQDFASSVQWWITAAAADPTQPLIDG